MNPSNRSAGFSPQDHSLPDGRRIPPDMRGGSGRSCGVNAALRSERRGPFSFNRGCRLPACLLGVALLVGASGCSRLPDDLRPLQAGLIEASGCDWTRQIRVGVPSGVLTLARWGLGWVELEPELRAALETMRGLRVALATLADGTADRRAMLSAADAILLGRGWERMVTVLERRELVAVYLPANLPPRPQLDLCVVVFDGRELVLVSGRANPEPLVELALRHVSEHREKLLAAGDRGG